jgi:hypothetical protein
VSEPAALLRQQILAAFDVNEEDLAALEEATGWNAAREAAEREREEFIAGMRRRAEEFSAELGEKFGGEVRWDDSPC